VDSAYLFVNAKREIPKIANIVRLEIILRDSLVDILRAATPSVPDEVPPL
jgi:hypothetical protein